ncbi:centrosomal protein of 68 kDa-like [Oncorhynchus nerka]|uniref:centrosomal protein of 68 kDa-like n=1 Tax=Oncorhynchus nerka TaxID=8023 RepID=UPI0011305AC4|nr:centrosomal protein of 68 kDa-like isoform X1 [Oncorhynchus nerka]XP_029496638.1 centrosomal protein of 68 kDa-like isoform X1 [Oncorhynchus nerka]
MELGVDRAFPAYVSPMESKGCSGRQKTRIPEFIQRSGTGRTTTQHSKDKGEERRKGDSGGPRKKADMAPTSGYMSDRRQYSIRTPVATTTEQQQASILKKSYVQEHPEHERQWEGSSNEADRHRADHQQESPDNLNPSQADISPCSASKEDLNTSLGMSDLRTGLSHEEPTFRSLYLGSRPGRHSPSSQPLEVHSFSTPLRPKWTSTLLSSLSPSYISHLRPSRQRRREQRMVAGEVYQSREEGGETYLNLGPSVGDPKGRSNPALHTMSPHQANYWPYAISSSLPHSPDRHSSSWDPDKEYQTLLDYTYPLRPGRGVGGWDTSELGGGSLIQTDPGLLDSGIELDRLCSSISLSALDFSLSATAGVGTSSAREMGMLGIGQRSSELRGFSHSKSSDGHLSTSPFFSADPIGLSVESLDYSGSGGGLNHSHRSGGGHYRQHGSSSSSSTTFIRRFSILPRPGNLGEWDWDEEFWPLPEQLEELQCLSQQVREVTAQLNQSVTANWDSLERGNNSVQSCMTMAEKQEAEEEREEQEQNKEEEREEEKEKEEESISEALQHFNKASNCGESFLSARGPGFRMEAGVVSRGVRMASLREAAGMVGGLTLPEFQSGSQGEQEQGESLMQHIQTFCSNLEELIQWLYTVVERMEVLEPPTVDIKSVKSSLADYKRFQREVNAHQPLTTSILQTGGLLLGCLTSTSPVLKETLCLIERQSKALETHSEHLFSSIISVMDRLTQPREPSGREETQAGDPDRMAVQRTAQ